MEDGIDALARASVHAVAWLWHNVFPNSLHTAAGMREPHSAGYQRSAVLPRIERGRILSAPAADCEGRASGFRCRDQRFDERVVELPLMIGFMNQSSDSFGQWSVLASTPYFPRHRTTACTAPRRERRAPKVGR